jgi:hypothetical protein
MKHEASYERAAFKAALALQPPVFFSATSSLIHLLMAASGEVIHACLGAEKLPKTKSERRCHIRHHDWLSGVSTAEMLQGGLLCASRTIILRGKIKRET